MVLHIKFSQLKMLEFSAVQFESIEQIARVEAPMLEELKLGRDESMQRWTT